MKLNQHINIGIAGSGAMGTGIAQVVASNGHRALIYDKNKDALLNARHNLVKIFNKLIKKGIYSQGQADTILSKIQFVDGLSQFNTCKLVIEAIIENLEVKKTVFHQLDSVTNNDCILATNTSSLSIASISSDVKHKERVVGMHFFNPAPKMPLVEIIPSMLTDEKVCNELKQLLESWGKIPIITKDTPGFIVNRIARPFYSEALKILDEGIADVATIDWTMKNLGKFKMGPFELMDLIGNDVNYTVTSTVWKQMYYDSRYKPSITQLRLKECGMYGKKSGKGFYKYDDNNIKIEEKVTQDEKLCKKILNRILVMLFNEAIDVYYLKIASKKDIETAMTKGVNYPKGLLKWADEFGLEQIYDQLMALQKKYMEERYRPSVLLKEMIDKNKSF